MTGLLIIALSLFYAGSQFMMGRSDPHERRVVRWLRVGSRLTMLGSVALLGLAILLRVCHVLPGLHWPWWLSAAVITVVLLGTPRAARFVAQRLVL